VAVFKGMPTDPSVEYSLFGQYVAATAKEPTHDRPQDLIEYWLAEWAKVYGGRRYPLGPIDVTHIRNALKRLGGDRAAFRIAASAYLADRSSFFSGHPLNHFVGQLSKFATVQPRKDGYANLARKPTRIL
jgi:hypothetical protein